MRGATWHLRDVRWRRARCHVPAGLPAAVQSVSSVFRARSGGSCGECDSDCARRSGGAWVLFGSCRSMRHERDVTCERLFALRCVCPCGACPRALRAANPRISRIRIQSTKRKFVFSRVFLVSSVFVRCFVLVRTSVHRDFRRFRSGVCSNPSRPIRDSRDLGDRAHRHIGPIASHLSPPPGRHERPRPLGCPRARTA